MNPNAILNNLPPDATKSRYSGRTGFLTKISQTSLVQTHSNMPGKPVIWLHFANTTELPELVREENEIRKVFADLHDEGFVEVICRHQLQIEEIFEDIDRYGDRIQIIHMAGHSDSDYLQLTSGGSNAKARAMGLGKRFGQLESLVLVFLNGCKNLGQVERMLAAGVSGVIATNKSVGDDSASIFSSQFYKALAEGASIDGAFRQGRTYLESLGDRTDADRQISIYRDLSNHRKDTPDFPWGLYLFRRHANRVLAWKVPSKSSRMKKRIQIGGAILASLVLISVLLFALIKPENSSMASRLFLIHNNDTLSTHGLAVIGDGFIGFDRAADHFSTDRAEIPSRATKDFFELLPAKYEIDSISYPQSGEKSFGLHVTQWVDTTLQIIRRSCLLRKELHTNWETHWDNENFKHIRDLDFNVETGTITYQTLDSQRDKEFEFQLYRNGQLHLNLKVNGSRPMICFAVVGGQIKIGDEELPPTKAMKINAKVVRQNSDAILPLIETNAAGRFFEVIPYDLLPGTVKGYNPNAQLCLRMAADSSNSWDCFPISKSILYTIGESDIMSEKKFD